jgi:P27 family predicted phage terminase small subunit
MGARGPAPKPTQLRVLHGETAPSRVNPNEAKPRAAAPQTPGWLSGRALEVWHRTCVELKHMGLLSAADGDALTVYCQAVAHYEEAVALVAQDGMMIPGRDGGVVKHPAMQFVRDQAVLIKVMAREFGLTPAARVGLSGDKGEEPGGAERLLS